MRPDFSLLDSIARNFSEFEIMLFNLNSLMTFLHAKSSLKIKSGTDEANADKVLLSVKLCIKSASIKKKYIIDRQVKRKGFQEYNHEVYPK